MVAFFKHVLSYIKFKVLFLRGFFVNKQSHWHAHWVKGVPTCLHMERKTIVVSLQAQSKHAVNTTNMYVITLTSFVRSGYESRSMHLFETKTSPSNNVSVIGELHLKAKQLTLSSAKQVNSQWLYRTVRYLIHSNAQWRYLVVLIKSWCNCVCLTIRRDVHSNVYTCVPQNSWSDF